MKLIGTMTSPYVRKVRVVMAEKKLEYQLVQDSPWDDAAAVRQANPLGKVPVLELKSGETVYDSRVIVEYLDTLSPVGKLLPASGRERVAVKTWEALADGMADAALLVKLEHTWPGRTPAQRSGAWVDFQMQKVRAGLAEMARMLEASNTHYCCGIYLTLADIAAGCTLDWLDFRFPELGWQQQYPRLAELLARLQERPSFADTRPTA